MASSMWMLTPWHSTSMLGRQRKNLNLDILNMSDEILFRNVTFKAASTVVKERTSKDEPIARSWGHRNHNFSQGNGPA